MISAALYDAVLGLAERRALAAWRRELLAGASGDVLEIGAGTGANAALYGPQVERLLLLEPDPAMQTRLVRRAPAGAHLLSASARRLPLRSASVDTVVSTLVLCSVGPLERPLAELRRVLRPSGRLLLLEHVAAPPGTRLRTVQAALTPLWARAAGGCSLERDTRAALTAAGFDTSALRDDVLPVPLPVVRPFLRGVARTA